MKRTYKAILIGIIFCVSLTGYASAQEFKVIVNSSNPVASLTQKEVSAYFLKKKTKWGDGTNVSPVDLNSTSSTRMSFSEEIHEKSVSSVKAYWQQSVFSGKAVPPTEKSSDGEIISYVKSNAGAIGYVSSGAGTNGVKVISVN